MRYEYKQVKYRSEDGRFDGSLNTMAAEGWKVESIDRIDGIFLFTYSRALGEHRVFRPARTSTSSTRLCMPIATHGSCR